MKKLIGLALFAGLLFSASNVIAATLSGTVIGEEAEDGLSSVVVAISGNTQVDGNARPVRISITPDEDGLFEFLDLDAGTYELSVASFSDKYLPEIYDDVPAYMKGEGTLIILEQNEVRGDIQIELVYRPYYFEKVTWEPYDLLQTGRGKAVLNVMNTTDSTAKMRFWVTLDVTRTDESIYNGLKSKVPVTRKNRLHKIRPGMNTVEIPVRIPEGIAESSRFGYYVSGGKTPWQPMLPEFRSQWYAYVVPLKPPVVIAPPRRPMPLPVEPPIVIADPILPNPPIHYEPFPAQPEFIPGPISFEVHEFQPVIGSSLHLESSFKTVKFVSPQNFREVTAVAADPNTDSSGQSAVEALYMINYTPTW